MSQENWKGPKDPTKLRPEAGSLRKFATRLRLDGPSGGVTVLATRQEFTSLEAFAQDLEARHIEFDPTGAGGHPRAEFDAREADGRLARIRLEYRPAGRRRAGRSIDRNPPLGDAFLLRTLQEEMGDRLMQSPWVAWDRGARVLRVSRPGYPELVQKWGESLIAEGEEPPGLPAKACAEGR